MVLEGDLGSVCSQTPAVLSESEWENIRLKNMEVNATLNFVPVPETDNLTSFIEDDVSNIDELLVCDAELEKLVEKEMTSHTAATNASLPVSESRDFFSQTDFSSQKATKGSENV